MVKPGGTGSPAFVISARPAPLPPRTSFILPSPSALPPPKKNTYLAGELCAVAILSVSTSGNVVAMYQSLLSYECLSCRAGHSRGRVAHVFLLLLRNDLREIGDRRKVTQQVSQ